MLAGVIPWSRPYGEEEEQEEAASRRPDSWLEAWVPYMPWRIPGASLWKLYA